VPNSPGQEVVYFSCKTLTNWTFLAELTFGGGGVKLCLKTEAVPYGQCANNSFETLLNQV